MTNQYDWLTKKTPRSVDALKLWPGNPRLNPEEEYNITTNFAEEMSHNNSDRTDLIDLAKSIASKGFIPADPVVIWQSESDKSYYVAEGNRRVLVLKLLRNPNLAPKSIRSTFIKLSKQIDKSDIKKIPVAVAPSFEDAEWYISQRNSMSSLQKRWESEQQRRWVYDLYKKYGGNIEIVKSKIDLTESELQNHIRLLKLRNLLEEVKNHLTEEEYKKANSIRFPITTFERFFTSSIVKEKWGIEFDNYEYNIISNRESFLAAYVQVIKRIILPQNDEEVINSRLLGNLEKIEKVLETLPSVSWENAVHDQGHRNEHTEDSEEQEDEEPEEEKSTLNKEAKDDPNRKRLIHVSYEVKSDQYRIVNLFNELKNIPFLYPNSIAASIRILLDLAVLNYIKVESLEESIQKKYGTKLIWIQLSKKLEFIRDQSNNPKVQLCLQKFLNKENEYSLDVLNGYQHDSDHHFISKKHLNNFWNFLFPLFKEFLDIEENDQN